MDYADKVAVVERYIEAFEKEDIAIIRDLYADNAVVEDPVESEPHRGLDAVCAFYEGALASGAKLTLTGPVRATAHTAAFPFQVTAGEMCLNIIDVFEFNSAGKVASMKAYWGLDNA